MFENFVFPDGTAPQWDSVNWLQKTFMKWFNNERLKKILTFPVETVNLLNDGKNFVDNEWADFTAEMWAEGHSFFVYTSDSVDSLASCCFDGSQMTLTKLNDKVNYMSFKDVYDLYNESIKNKDNHFTIFHDGKWVDGKVIRVHKRPLYKITTSNDKQIIVTDNHLSPTQDGDKKTTDLTTKDYLKFSIKTMINNTITNNPEFNPQYISGAKYMWKNNSIYYKIKSIEPYENNNDYCYCFEMDNVNEPYFTLPNGIITHNCRLKNEVTENTFSYTLGAGGVSTGSKGVMTINLNRLIQNTIDKNSDLNMSQKLQKISDSVREQVQKIHKYMTAYNEIVKDNFNAHMLPIYEAGFIALEKQYLTIGINGFVEGAEYLGIEPNVNEQYLQYGEAILKPIYEENKKDKTKEIMFNTEFVPAENLGVKNAKWDKADGYFVPRDCYNSYFYRVEDTNVNIIDKFMLHGSRLTKYLDGGSALHMNLAEHLTKEQYLNLMHTAIKTGCSYFTFNIPNTICNDCGHISKHRLSKCPKCGSTNLDYATRVIGYLKRISNFSEQRQKEAAKRYYAEP